MLLCGLSAGSLCWFSDAVTAFHGPSERVKGLGLLPHSNCVHYDGEPERRAAYRRMVAAGLRGGFGVDDGAALSFVGDRLDEVVTSKPRATAYAVGLGARGQVHERRLEARLLGASDGGRAPRPLPAEAAAVPADDGDDGAVVPFSDDDVRRPAAGASRPPLRGADRAVAA